MTDFVGGPDADVFVGSNDADTAVGNGGNDTLTGNGGNDELEGNAGADFLDGGDGDDSLYAGNAFAGSDRGSDRDTLIGGAGDDTIIAGYGDTIDGGSDGALGDRLYISFLGAPSGVAVDFRQPSVTVGGATISGIELVRDVEGSNFDDEIVLARGPGFLTTYVSGMGGNDHIVTSYYTYSLFGNDGDDILDARDSPNLALLEGGPGNDTIYTSAETIYIAYGGDGDDIIYGHKIDGGAGNDSIFADGSIYPSSLHGGAGHDTMYAASNGVGILYGDEGADYLIGGEAADRFVGGAGNDRIEGHGETPVIFNIHSGDVAVYGGQRSDYTIAQDSGTGVVTITDLRPGSPDGIDTLTGIEVLELGNVSYQLEAILAGHENDPADFIGTANADIYYGSEIENTAFGDGGDDSFKTYGGNDTLEGGAGADMLDGGDGDDVLYAAGQADLYDRGIEQDTLIGGLGNDRLYAGYGDTVDGGPLFGFDALYVSFLGAPTGVTADFRQASVTVGGGTISQIYTVNFVEGSQFDDDITLNSGTAYFGLGSVYGMGGNDRLVAGFYTAAVYGGAGNDYLDAEQSFSLNVIDGGPGDDEIHVKIGSAVLAYGGDGSDTIFAAGTIYGGDGNDDITIWPSSFSTKAYGGPGADTFRFPVQGGIEAFGEEGNDTFWGFGGRDIFIGGPGNDLIFGSVQSSAGTSPYAGDVAVYSGSVLDYSFPSISNSGYFYVVDQRPGSPDGTDLLTEVEILKFADATYRVEQILAGHASGVLNFTGGAGSDTYYGSEDDNSALGSGGDDILYGYGGNDILQGDAGNDTLDGGTGSNTLDGGDGDDLFRLEQGANDVAIGGTGNDAFYFGAEFTGGDTVDGGAGTRDQLGLQGNYAGGVSFGTNVTGIEQVILLPGNDTRFGDVSGAFYSYALTTGNAAIAAGQQMVFQANILRAGENFTLDASGELDGSVFTYGGQGNDALTGSQGSDAFFFGTARFGAADVVNGQGGALDSLGLQGNYAGASAVSFGAGQLIGVEQLVFLSNSDTRFGGAGSGTPYNYTITTHDGNVAAGSRMIIQANTLVSDEVLNFNGSAELDGVFSIFSGNGADTLRGGAGNDTISGRGGADMLFGGGGNDTFLYTNLTDSTPGARDTFGDFSTGDLIDLSRLDAITGGANDAFSFIGSAAFSNTAGQLRAVNTGGSNWLVEADTNGDAIADFALFLTVSDNHPITVSDFLP